MMTHQAGLTPWIPFYKKTVTNGVLNPAQDTTDNFRYATLNGIRVALPTYGGAWMETGISTCLPMATTICKQVPQ